MGRRCSSWVEWAEGTKGSLECTLLSHVRFNGADVNGWTQRWVYKNCLPEESVFKGGPEPEPGWLTPTCEQLWGKSKAVERLSMCWFHHCALLCSCANSFPTLISSAVLMAASNNPIYYNNEIKSFKACPNFPLSVLFYFLSSFVLPSSLWREWHNHYLAKWEALVFGRCTQQFAVL